MPHHTPHNATPARSFLTSEAAAIASHLPGYLVADELEQVHGDAVVVLIGPACQASTPPHQPPTPHQHRHRLLLNSQAAPGRWAVSGGWPVDCEHRPHVPNDPVRISVSRDKPPEKIAADIERRLLRWYDAEFSRQLTSVFELNEHIQRRRELFDKLAEIVLGSLTNPTNPTDPTDKLSHAPRDVRSHNFDNRIYSGGTTVEVCLDGTVRIQTGYLDAEKAVAAVERLAEVGAFER